MLGTFLLIHRTRAQQPTPTRPHVHTLTQSSPVTVRILFPTTEDSPITGGIVPVVVEVREPVSEQGMFWTERLLIGVGEAVLLDATQLSGGAYDPATQEMVYRVLTPLWTIGWVNGSMGQWGNGIQEGSATETFLWVQVQWVGVPLHDKKGAGGVGYRAGDVTDTVDITVDSEGSLIVSKSASLSAAKGTGTRAGASKRVVMSARRVERGRRRSVNALRKEAQRWLRQARRPNKNKRGGKMDASSKPYPRPDSKRLAIIDGDVCHVNLVIDNLPEETEPAPNEENPGAFIGLNDDDDNNNGIPDKDENGTVGGEDDLVLLQMSLETPETELGMLTLNWPRVKVKVWTEPSKGTELIPPAVWEGVKPPPFLYVEGVGVSEVERDVELRLRYIPRDTTLDPCEDRVLATVFAVESVSPDVLLLCQGRIDKRIRVEYACP